MAVELPKELTENIASIRELKTKLEARQTRISARAKKLKELFEEVKQGGSRVDIKVFELGVKVFDTALYDINDFIASVRDELHKMSVGLENLKRLRSKPGQQALIDYMITDSGLTRRNMDQGVKVFNVWLEHFQSETEREIDEFISEEEDELYSEAKELAINVGKASPALLQRGLSIGYSRAAKLMKLLETHGIIGPPDGAKPRDVIIKPDDESLS